MQAIITDHRGTRQVSIFDSGFESSILIAQHVWSDYLKRGKVSELESNWRKNAIEHLMDAYDEGIMLIWESKDE